MPVESTLIVNQIEIESTRWLLTVMFKTPRPKHKAVRQAKFHLSFTYLVGFKMTLDDASCHLDTSHRIDKT